MLGLVGTNGIGKSTALKILAGKQKPNLGRFDVRQLFKDMFEYKGDLWIRGFLLKSKIGSLCQETAPSQ